MPESTNPQFLRSENEAYHTGLAASTAADHLVAVRTPQTSLWLDDTGIIYPSSFAPTGRTSVKKDLTREGTMSGEDDKA